MDFFNVIEIVFSLVFAVSVIEAGSPRNYNRQPYHKSLKGIWQDNIQNQNLNVPLEHQTRSDAMQLYSIGSKQIAKVKESREKSWEEPTYELTMTPKTRGRRDNTFVTETVSYQRLKIRSADNQKYLCARKNGEIVFKVKADKQNEATLSFEDDDRAYSSTKADKKNKARKRCLFHWEFTKQMHIQLSLEAGNKKYFLSVKDNVMSLREEKETTEIERSFIWLPTKPLKGQTRKSVSFANGRSRKFDDTPEFEKLTVPKAVLIEKDEEIERLREEVDRLKNKVREIRDLEKQMEDLTSS